MEPAMILLTISAVNVMLAGLEDSVRWILIIALLMTLSLAPVMMLVLMSALMEIPRLHANASLDLTDTTVQEISMIVCLIPA
jgi:ABC-type spermidine/putrescine transport system permease subunit I